MPRSSTPRKTGRRYCLTSAENTLVVWLSGHGTIVNISPLRKNAKVHIAGTSSEEGILSIQCELIPQEFRPLSIESPSLWTEAHRNALAHALASWTDGL